MKDNYDVVVIGGGPAGMIAAGRAAERGASTLIVDKLRLPGKKLSITGKGRCNITNNCEVRDVLANTVRNPRFLYSSVSAFPPERVMEFFEKRGVPLKTERGKRVFPVSDRADDIAYALASYASGAEREIGTVKSVELCASRVASVRFDGGRRIKAAAVVIATGGMSYPLTGSTGDGYRMAAECLHSVEEISPSLVPLISGDKLCRDAMGVSLKNIAVAFYENGKKCHEEFGELLFTHFGLSGPCILSGSAHFCDLGGGSEKYIVIDLKPALDLKTLDRRILREIEENPNRNMINLTRSLLPSSLVTPVLRKAGIEPELKANSLTREGRASLCAVLKAIRLDISGARPISEAIVTRGGVSVKEIEPKTMESKKISGLFFAGEVIDVDCYTGGFNLQAALSTGYAAGSAAGERRFGQE